jgi:hypothetical protein
MSNGNSVYWIAKEATPIDELLSDAYLQRMYIKFPGSWKGRTKRFYEEIYGFHIVLMATVALNVVEIFPPGINTDNCMILATNRWILCDKIVQTAMTNSEVLSFREAYINRTVSCELMMKEKNPVQFGVWFCEECIFEAIYDIFRAQPYKKSCWNRCRTRY